MDSEDDQLPLDMQNIEKQDMDNQSDEDDKVVLRKRSSTADPPQIEEGRHRNSYSKFRRLRSLSDPFKRLSLTRKIHENRQRHIENSIKENGIQYNMKFIGELQVNHSKGSEVVLKAVQNMQSNLPDSTLDSKKLPKVVISISVNNICIQDRTSKATLYRYPLHRISFCSDPGGDILAFIAQAGDCNLHYCYALYSRKHAKDACQIVGKAFHLAFSGYITRIGEDVDVRKKLYLLNRKADQLQLENSILRIRVADLEELRDKSPIKDHWTEYKNNNYTTETRLSDQLPMSNFDNRTVTALTNEILSSRSVVGRKLENLVFDDHGTTSEEQQEPSGAVECASDNNNIPTLSPPPEHRRPRPQANKSTPTSQTNSLEDQNVDLFGMESFQPKT